MKIFIDTANIEEIKEIAQWGILDGVTTNPSLIAKEGKDLRQTINGICALVNGPVNAEVISLKCNDMINEARELSKIHENVVIKIPMCEEGLKATSILSKEGIKTNITLIFSLQQAILASKAGANYVSPFLGRIDDIGGSGIELIKDIYEVFTKYSISTEIIAASIRNTTHIAECAKIGVDIATIPYKVLMQMLKHPLTDIGIKKFLDDYNKSIQNNTIPSNAQNNIQNNTIPSNAQNNIQNNTIPSNAQNNIQNNTVPSNTQNNMQGNNTLSNVQNNIPNNNISNNTNLNSNL
jgi:transaldolase